MENDALNRYFDDIGRRPQLTADEERQLAERIRQGDLRALTRLVEANLRFVVKIATQYRGQGLDLNDLISEGNIGLMKAAGKFDPSRGTPFVNYAVVHIRQYIERALGLLGTEARQSSAEAAKHRPLSVDAPLGRRSNMSLLSVLVNPQSPLADEHTHSEAIEEAVELALLSLSPRERQVVDAFYGIGREHATLAEIAADMELKRERVRQIRNRAVRRLKKLYRQKLKEVRGK